MATIQDIIRISKIDLTNLIIRYDSPVCFDYELEVDPYEFLDFSKSDIQDKSKKGLINSMSNAKRAIDSQIDKTLLSLGYDINNLPLYFHEFANEVGVNNKNITFKLLILECLNIAPSNVISNIRKIRHKLEHEYIVPTYQQVVNAIEIADLFINAVENKLIKSSIFEITDREHIERIPDGFVSGIDFDYNNYTISVSYDELKANKKLKFDEIAKSKYSGGNFKRYNVTLNHKNKEFSAILRMFMSYYSDKIMLDSIRYLLSLINIDTPLDKVKIKDV